MILRELKQYIEQQGCVSQRELAKKFALSEDGVDAMLAVWVRKGQISRLVDTNKAHRVMRVRYSANCSDGIALTVTM
ncbi:FeoC-like transcriptional regulator [Vibrio sp. Isolate25]|uniref:FeoC-like transcriptional regulator n=1 Tax=unclassified Vibrio TaxID=2614977 RepID=UPI001EFD692E|nr:MULTISPECIES: FeoC-like transcriptional regulator [unclassified Vibrio]MCG9598149.1 FeoC-like transcriptional regulator [Vibrio sp. Isolate25]MCG9679569.1 FeoC-like transcriptional regulator [Vibrio sp. Isolate24]